MSTLSDPNYPYDGCDAPIPSCINCTAAWEKERYDEVWCFKWLKEYGNTLENGPRKTQIL